MNPIQLIEKIHSEFDSAQDRLLQQAEQIIAQKAETQEDLAHRLVKVGFHKTPLVNKFRLKWKQLVSGMDQAKLIRHYKQTYPFLKFITEDELHRICNKYDLIHAPIGNYIGEVPDKNVRDIENMQALKPEDNPQDRIYCKVNFHSWWLPDNMFYSIWDKKLPSIIEGRHFGHWYSASEYFQQHFGIEKEYIADSITNYTESKQGLFICAPSINFDLKGLGAVKSGFASIFQAPVKDPIVYRYVRGGCQIITKWGLEASDSWLINAIDN